MDDIYKTIEIPSIETLFKDRNSKFYGYAFPVANEDAVKSYLELLRKKHHTARHFCYAWQLGIESIRFRANDDGEPANSAGAPILGQIRSAGITNTYIAVVRYFGGTKLGVGGLIQAYKLGAALALKENEIIEVEPQASLSFKIGFDLMGTILPIIDKNILDAKIENHTDGVQIGLTFNEKDESIIRGLFERWVTI